MNYLRQLFGPSFHEARETLARLERSLRATAPNSAPELLASERSTTTCQCCGSTRLVSQSHFIFVEFTTSSAFGNRGGRIESDGIALYPRCRNCFEKCTKIENYASPDFSGRLFEWGPLVGLFCGLLIVIVIGRSLPSVRNNVIASSVVTMFSPAISIFVGLLLKRSDRTARKERLYALAKMNSPERIRKTYHPNRGPLGMLFHAYSARSRIISCQQYRLRAGLPPEPEQQENLGLACLGVLAKILGVGLLCGLFFGLIIPRVIRIAFG